MLSVRNRLHCKAFTYENIGKSASREGEKDEGCSEHHSGGYAGALVLEKNVLVGGERVRAARRQTRTQWTGDEGDDERAEFSFFLLPPISAVYLVRSCLTPSWCRCIAPGPVKVT